MKKILFLFLAAVVPAMAATVVYQNNFESYNTGEVRKPAQDAVPYMEYNANTNTIHCDIEAASGVDDSKGLHCFILKSDGLTSTTGSAQFNTGIDPTVFSSPCEVVYSIDWKASSNLASIDLTNGTNLFFRLFANGGCARRICVTNKVQYATDKKEIELTGEESDPSRVSCSSDWGTYSIHILFPEARINLIERKLPNGTVYSFPQGEVYGIPGVLPTHFGAGIRGRSYSLNDRNCFADNIEVTYESLSTPKLGVSGVTKVAMNANAPILTVSNDGTGTFTATVDVLEGSGFFSFEEDTAESGSFSFDVSDPVILHTKVDREVLGCAYGRAKVRVSGAGDEKILNYTIQSGSDEEGYMLYASDFETTELGDITAVDPDWVPSGTVNGCKVVVDGEAGNCLQIVNARALHLNCNMPTGLADKFDVKVSMNVKIPEYENVSRITFGTDLGHRQGEYSLRPNAETQEVSFTLDNVPSASITNKVSMNEWFHLSYTFNTLVENRVLRAVTFGESSYEFNAGIDLGSATGIDKDFFTQFRDYTWTSDTLYYLDDISIELVPRGQGKPPIMSVVPADDPVPFTAESTEIKLYNLGSGSYDYTLEILEGASYLTLNTTTGTVATSASITANIKRSAMGFGFFTPKIKISSTTEGVDDYILTLHIPSGSPDDGYLIYSSDFDSLELTEEVDGTVVNELSTQDSCWLPTDPNNRIDVVKDPENEDNQCAKIINCRYNSKGYHLNLQIPAEYAEDYDVVYSMKIRIPKSYVDGSEGTALFCVSQEDINRQCEIYLYLNEEDSALPVWTALHDAEDQEWWEKVQPDSYVVESEKWFDFNLRFNCKLVDFDHKLIRSYVFGDNDYQFDEVSGQLTYPGGIRTEVLNNEALSKLKFWSYKYNADILIDDLQVSLIPVGVPEPAFFGLALLTLLFLRRK